ncbi:uncharacterized protein DS421_11g340000 [Arachis hypogaea]|nr:uncharacterized protein DS421_11g340000 [Arachis hypogaea]
MLPLISLLLAKCLTFCFFFSFFALSPLFSIVKTPTPSTFSLPPLPPTSSSFSI